MPLHEIKNNRILKFWEKLLGYPIEMVHVKGATHTFADRLSRYPVKNNHCPDLEDRYVPHVASKSLRTKEAGNAPTDPHVTKLAEMAQRMKITLIW